MSTCSRWRAGANLSVHPVDAEERRRILSLTQDLPRLWHAASATNVERKQLLGLLIKDVTLYAGEAMIRISIRWQAEACTTLEVPRVRRMWDLRRTDSAVIERIRTMATTRTDGQIVSELNKRRYCSGTKSAFTLSTVR